MVRSHLDWRRASGLLPSAVKSAGHMDGTVRWWASLTGLDGRQSAVLGGAGADTDASGALSREDLAFFAVRGEYGDWQGRLHGKAERSAKERCRDAAKGASGGWCSLIFEAALLRLSSATCPFRHSHSLRPSPGPDAHTDPTISAIAAAIVLFAAAATPALFAAAVRVKPDTRPPAQSWTDSSRTSFGDLLFFLSVRSDHRSASLHLDLAPLLPDIFSLIFYLLHLQ